MKQVKIIKNQPKINYTQKEIDYIERNKSTNIDFDYLFLNNMSDFDLELREIINLEILNFSKLRDRDYKDIPEEKINKIFTNVKDNYPTKSLYNEINLITKIILNEF